MNEQAEIAIIGGTGVQAPELLENIRHIDVDTQYGRPSCHIVVGEYAGKTIAFLPRHGKGHNVAPHKINYRANIAALKKLGVKRILAACATGSLQPECKPGDLVFVDQFVDWTHGRINTFFEEGEVFHTSLAEPVCSELHENLIPLATSLNLPFHEKGTYVCIQGPRYNTKAESVFFKDILNVQVIGMTMATECALAREAEICYLPIACVTDYDAWSDSHVSAKMVRETMQKNVANVKKLIFEFIKSIPSERASCECAEALAEAEQ